MILAGLAIAGATTTYCFSQNNQEIAVTTPAPAEAVVATEAANAPVTPTNISAEDAAVVESLIMQLEESYTK